MSVEWRSLPSLSALRAFDATARHGGFSGAARSLNVTHAAVSQQVRALEADIGVRLVTRKGRAMQLTDDGEVLAAALSGGFEAIADGVNAVRDRHGRRGLRVTTTQFIVDHTILPNLSEFWSHHPGVEISFFPSRLPVDVVAEGFDFGIQFESENQPLPWQGVEKVLLAKVELKALGSAELVDTLGDDPHDYPWINHEGIEPKLKMMAEGGLDLERLRMVDIGSPAILVSAIRQGVGLSLFNIVVGRADMASGLLKEVPLPKPLFIDYVAVIPKGPRPPKVDAFVDWVRTLF